MACEKSMKLIIVANVFVAQKTTLFLWLDAWATNKTAFVSESLVYTAQSYTSQTICQKHVTSILVKPQHVTKIEQHMVLTQRNTDE